MLDFLAGVIEAIYALSDYVRDFFYCFLKNLECHFIKSFNSVIDYFGDFVNGLLLDAIETFPDSGFSLGDMFHHANYWFPVVEGLAAISLYFGFWVTWMSVKLVIKLIPTIG